tara:strand:+ start:911 stop:1462 length:552 start_codon:yes stop_codon:yes gene_type:complete
MHLENLFPTKFRHKIIEGNEELNKELITDICKETVTGKPAFRSFSKNDLSWQSNKMTTESFLTLSSQIELLLGAEYRVTNIWANVIEGAGGFSRPHFHPSSKSETLTGVYYPQGLIETDDYFHNTWSEQEGCLVFLDPTGSHKTTSIDTVESLLCIFPQWATHMVAPMTSDRRRYSISFTIVS